MRVFIRGGKDEVESISDVLQVYGEINDIVEAHDERAGTYEVRWSACREGIVAAIHRGYGKHVDYEEAKQMLIYLESILIEVQKRLKGLAHIVKAIEGDEVRLVMLGEALERTMNFKVPHYSRDIEVKNGPPF